MKPTDCWDSFSLSPCTCTVTARINKSSALAGLLCYVLLNPRERCLTLSVKLTSVETRRHIKSWLCLGGLQDFLVILFDFAPPACTSQFLWGWSWWRHSDTSSTWRRLLSFPFCRAQVLLLSLATHFFLFTRLHITYTLSNKAQFSK